MRGNPEFREGESTDSTDEKGKALQLFAESLSWEKEWCWVQRKRKSVTRMSPLGGRQTGVWRGSLCVSQTVGFALNYKAAGGSKEMLRKVGFSRCIYFSGFLLLI